MRSVFFTPCFAILCLALPGIAQHSLPNYRDLTITRHRPWAMKEFLEFRAGLLGSLAEGEDIARFVEDSDGFDGHVFVRKNNVLSNSDRVDAYIGRDGFYASLINGDPVRQPGYTRFEFHGRQWGHFIREGFYQSDKFIPTGFYNAKDWRARILFATTIQEGFKGEFGPFIGNNEFSRNEQTDNNFVIPDDYTTYGVSLRLEENKLSTDPASYLPQKGFLLSLWMDREWNDSNVQFGSLGRRSSLPSVITRGGAHLEYYIPQTQTGTIIINADAAMSPDDDRIQIYDSSKPIGETFVDIRVDYRILLSDSWSFIPGIRGQWVSVADEFNTSTDSEIFWGVQAALRYDPSSSFAIVAEYSFLTNESREPISIANDSLGEHRFFFGFEWRPQ